MFFVVASRRQLIHNTKPSTVCQQLFSFYFENLFFALPPRIVPVRERICGEKKKAEKEGFEPSRRFYPTYTLSRGASSAS